MAHERAIAQALDSLWNKSSERNLIRGRLGLPGGGSPVFDVPDKPGYKYVNKGAAGEQGQVIARDPIGVANTYNQSVWMRYEFGEYVIQRADSVAGGSGGGGGASNLDALTDVTLTTPANGNTLAYNSTTGQWVNVVPAGGASGAPSPHAHSSVHHTGLLPWAELNKSGSSLGDLTTRSHSLLTGIGANDHHAQQHVLATGTALGPDHTISGAAAGEVLRAIDATHAAFDVLQHTDLGNILPDQHHRRDHNIITGDVDGNAVHSITGSQFQVVGATAPNVLGLLTPTPTPGAAAAILRTDAAGGIALDTTLFVVNGAADIVTIDTNLFVVNGAADIVTIDTNLLYVDAPNNWIGVNRTPSGATIDVIAAANADHTQRIKQKSGQTGRMWRIEDTGGNELIVLDSVGNLQSGRPGFVSGLTGWQITPQGNAEFNNIWARGELHATVFVKDEVHATGGSFFVATAGVLYDDAVINSTLVDDDVLVVYSTPAGMGVPLQVVTTSGTFVGSELHVAWVGNFLNINDPPSGPGFYFQPGDVVRSKTEIPTGVTDFWLEVINATQNSGYSSYSVIKRSGTDGTLPKGSAVVSYGKQGDGRIMMTSDLNYAPYIDVFTTGVNVWTGAAGSVIPRVRLGRLDGIGLPGVSGVEQYGMIAGKDLSDANSGYLIASNLQFSLYKVDIRLNNGVSDTGLWTADGNLRIGSNIAADATTGFRVYTTSVSGHNSGDVIIGNEATGNFLRWSGGILTVSGALVVSDPGTTVTKGYVDGQDQAYDLLAGGTYNTNGILGGYALVGQTNAITYSDARRITGVTGTWTSAANQISWTSLAATLANGGSRSIAPGNTGVITVRTYLYVDISLAGTLTMIPLNTPAVSQPNYVLIAVCDPGTPKASVTVVAGTTFISGANIATGSIQAANIAAGTITADKLVAGTITVSYLDPAYTSAVNSGIGSADAKGQQGIDDAYAASIAAANAQTNSQAYSDNRRVLGVTGNWFHTDGITIGWNSLQVKFANGSSRGITFQNSHVLTPAGRHYLYVDMLVGGNMPMLDTMALSDLGVNNALIAVADTGAVQASISIVAGSTYISGDNIMTGSIVAANIAVGTITADRLDAATLTSTYLDPVASAAATDATTKAGNATTAATTSAENRRVLGVTGTWSVTDGATIGWSGLRVKFANGSDRGITFQNSHALTPAGRHYLYVNMAGTGNMAMLDTTDISVLGSDNALIAVADTGAVKASISVVAGSTYISGSNIMTGSIVTTLLAAGAVTAGKIDVDGNIDIAGAGKLTIGVTGKIHSAGKPDFGNATPGIFLGYDTAFPIATYKFKVGDITKSQFSWDGSGLAILGTQSLQISNTASGQIFSLNGPSGATGLLTLNSSGVLVFAGSAGINSGLNAPLMTANKFIQTGDTLQLVTPRVVASAQTMPGSLGFKGEMCWGIDGIGVLWLYLCYADNNWRRIAFPTTTW